MNYFSDRWAEVADRAKVAWYVARDVGKEGQKRVPKGFGRVRPWWGAVGMREPEAVVEEVSYRVYVRMYERLEKWNVGHGLPVGRGPAFGGIMSPMMRDHEGALLLCEVEAELASEGLFGR